MNYTIRAGDAGVPVLVSPEGGGWRVRVGEETLHVEVMGVGGGGWLIRADGRQLVVVVAGEGKTRFVHAGGRHYRVELHPGTGAGHGAASEDGSLSSPMPGKVIKRLVEEEAVVEKGQPLVVVEAMKMEWEIVAPYAGRVVRFLQAVGEMVEGGVPLVELAREEAE